MGVKIIKELFAGNDHCSDFIMKPYIIAEAGVNHEGKIEDWC